MPFALVLFKDKNELAVVPITWLKGNSCFWPNCKNKIVRKHVLAQTQPGVDWFSYEIKILSIYDTFEEAIKHERKAEELDTSNIDTDPERLGRGHRLKKFPKRKRSSSSSSEGNEEIQYPPVPEEYAVLEVNTQHSVQNLEREGIVTPSCIVFGQNDVPHSSQIWQNSEPAQNIRKDDSVVRSECGTLNQNPCSSQVWHIKDSDQNMVDSPEYILGVQNNAACSNQLKQKSDQNVSQDLRSSQDNSRLVKEMLQIKMILKEQGDMLQSILFAVNSLMEKDTTSAVSSDHKLLNLPRETYEDVMSLETELVDEDLQEHLCKILAQGGGSSLGNSIRRMLKHVMTNTAAVSFSWLGAKEKKPFVNLKLRKIIYDAVRKNKLYENIKDSEIETSIKDWLRHAKARIKSEEKIL